MTLIETKAIESGMIVRVHQRIVEGTKERVQVFEGTVIKRRAGNTMGATFTVRKKSGNIWVEKIFPVHVPTIEKVELVKVQRVRRAQLTFLRDVTYKKKIADVTEKYLKKHEKSKDAKPS